MGIAWEDEVQQTVEGTRRWGEGVRAGRGRWLAGRLGGVGFFPPSSVPKCDEDRKQGGEHGTLVTLETVA